jgi:hypothetical protein
MTKPSPLQTVCPQWLERTPAQAAVVVDMTADNLDFSNVIVGPRASYQLATSSVLDIDTSFHRGANSLMVTYYGADTLGTFTPEIFAWRNGPYGPGVPVFLGSALGSSLGTYDVNVLPATGSLVVGDYFWAGTLAGTDCWSNGVAITDSGNSRFCTLTFDTAGFRFFKFYAVLGTATQIYAAISAV